MKGLLNNYGVWMVAALIILLVPIPFGSGFALSIASQMTIAIVFALAYNMLLGQGGMLSFGHAIFFGLAGYFTIHYLNWMGQGVVSYFPVSLLPLLGGLVSMVLGVLIGLVSTRRAGTTFAMISLGFGEMVTALTLIIVSFFNGEEGIQGDRWVGPEPLGITFGSDVQVYYLAGAWCFAAAVAMYAITRTPFGRMCNAVRDNPERAQFVGYNTQRVRWLAFTLSAFFSGIAGTLHALVFEHVGFETVDIARSGFVLFMVYIGGTGTFLGPVLGAVLITWLTSILSNFTEAWYLYFGIIFVTIVMYAPGGLAGLIFMHEPIWLTDPRLLRRLLWPYALGLASVLVALVGIIGEMEMIYHLSNDITGEFVMNLYGFDISLRNTVPWVICAIIGAIGLALCRKSFPLVAQHWHQVMHEARERVLQ
ncbi:MAG: branched-chain amino acid ABC transporter permease [Candidatus Lambdaproteobacteria bacterium]|nr:branched-chain amino acid ABC transporter permease [Candidatus Lambdaproteobacteria bacterium]